MVPKGKLKGVDDLVERREEWVQAIKQAYVTDASTVGVKPVLIRGTSRTYTNTVKRTGNIVMLLQQESNQSFIFPDVLPVFP